MSDGVGGRREVLIPLHIVLPLGYAFVVGLFAYLAWAGVL